MHIVEGEVADFEDILVGTVLVERAAHGGVEARQQFFHGEGLGDIVVGTHFEAFQLVLFQVFGSQEDNRNLLVHLSDFLSDSKTIL